MDCIKLGMRMENPDTRLTISISRNKDQNNVGTKMVHWVSLSGILMINKKEIRHFVIQMEELSYK